MLPCCVGLALPLVSGIMFVKYAVCSNYLWLFLSSNLRQKRHQRCNAPLRVSGALLQLRHCLRLNNAIWWGENLNERYYPYKAMRQTDKP